MHPDYSPLRRFTRWISRWRHRRGYGVHSPWAFSWITQVIYNDMAYYAYADLQRRRRLPAADPESLAGTLSEKDDRLLFRVANAAEANDIAVVGAVGAREIAYLWQRAHRHGSQLTQRSRLLRKSGRGSTIFSISPRLNCCLPAIFRRLFSTTRTLRTADLWWCGA